MSGPFPLTEDASRRWLAAVDPRLKLVWTHPTGEVGAHQAPPLVNNGVMFVSTPNNQVAAYDAKTGTLLSRYQRPRPQGAFVAPPSTRGAGTPARVGNG